MSLYLFTYNVYILQLGKQRYGAIDYRGTWYIADDNADDFIGFVFGYTTNRKFYLITWKRNNENYLDLDNSTYKGGIRGMQLKVFHVELPYYSQF